MIRKTIFIAVMAAFGILAANAQEEASTNRAVKRAEMTEKSAEKFVKEFNLEGDAQKSFVQTYSNYVEELANCDSAVKSGSSQAGKKEAGKKEAGKKVDGKKAELTDAEATEKLNDMLTRQQNAIESMKARLEVQKKYVAEFGKVLTPAQVYKVMGRQRTQAGQRPGLQQGGAGRSAMGRERMGRGGFGGGGFDGGFGGDSF